MAGVEKVITEAEVIMIAVAFTTEAEDITVAGVLTEAAMTIADSQERKRVSGMRLQGASLRKVHERQSVKGEFGLTDIESAMYRNDGIKSGGVPKNQKSRA